MSALGRKLWRDLWQMKGPAIAIILVVASGIAVFVSSLATLDSLELTRTAYYEHYRFAHVFARARRAPEDVARRAAEIPGVVQAQPRVVMDVNLSVPGMNLPAIGRLISIPERRAPILNDVYLREGRWIEPGRDDEVIVSEAFAMKRGLHPGDALVVVVNGKQRRLEIVGVGLSPEYVYQISGASPWPDDDRFAVLWMGQASLSASVDMEGAFNDLTLTLSNGASLQDVLTAVDRLLAPYGGLGAHGRDRQVSDQFLSDEFRQLRTTGVFIPGIFLAVAAFLLNIVISRVISTQRGQIATLKAFGYTNGAIALHYLEMALILVVLGAALGDGLGLWLGGGMTRLYAEYYKFPVLELRITASTAALGVVVSLASATAGVGFSVWRAVRLPPAEAMRPEAPARFRPTLIERLGFGRLMTPAARMITRNLGRRPVRSLLGAVGVAFAVAIVVVGRFSEDAINHMITLQFRLAQLEDATVLFYQPLPRSALDDLEHVDGVLRAEPMRAAPVILRSGHRERRTAIIGADPRSELNRLIDRHGERARVPDEGLLLGAYVADKLGVRPGDAVTVEVLDGRRETRQVQVTALVDDILGATASMNIDALNRLLGEGDTVSGAYLAIDPLRDEAVNEELKRTPAVAGVSATKTALASFERLMEESIGLMRAVQIVFSSIIAFAVVYNKARISLAERSRELASLRVLGFTRGEVSLILLGELGVTTLAGIPLGLGLGYYFAWAMCKAYEQNEMFRFPLVISTSTYAYAALVVLIAAAISALVVRRRIDQLDLVGVLKTRD